MPQVPLAYPHSPADFSAAARDIVAGWPPFTEQQIGELTLALAESTPAALQAAA